MLTCVLLLGLIIAVLFCILLKIGENSNETKGGSPQGWGCPPIQASAGIRGLATNAPIITTAGASLMVVSSFYRLKDGSGDYQFRFQQHAEGWFRVYILQTPRDKNGADSCGQHVLHDAGGPYICWSVPIEDFGDAKEIAARWAEATELWHRTGKTF